jgi:hypothetical protein
VPTYLATALIALGGAIFGAVASTGTQLLIERTRASREREAHENEVRTAARMLMSDLARARFNLAYSHASGKWWPAGGLGARISDDDRRLVFGALASEDVYAIDLAEARIDQWYSLRSSGGRMPSGHGELLDPVLKLIDDAAAKVQVLAGVAGSGSTWSLAGTEAENPSEGLEDNA